MKDLKEIIEKLKIHTTWANDENYEYVKDGEVIITISEAQQIIEALEQLDRIWGKLATTEQALEIRIEQVEKMSKLVEWLDDECTHGSMTNDLSHDFADILRNKLDKIATKTPITNGEITEKILTQIAKEHGHTSFPSFIEHLTSIEIYDFVCSIFESHALLLTDEEIEAEAKECFYSLSDLETLISFINGMKHYRSLIQGATFARNSSPVIIGKIEWSIDGCAYCNGKLIGSIILTKGNKFEAFDINQWKIGQKYNTEAEAKQTVEKSFHEFMDTVTVKSKGG